MKENYNNFTDEEIAQDKQQKSRNRIFGILVATLVLLSAIFIYEIVSLLV